MIVRDIEPPARSLVERIYETLVDRIVSRQLEAGAALQERPLAASMGVSRTPLREALNRLEGERLIERQSGGALIVKPMTLIDYIEVLQVRTALEGAAAESAAGRIPSATLVALRKRLETLRDAGDPTVPEHLATDADLHDAIMEAVGNTLLWQIVNDLRRKTRMFSMKRMPERFASICMEHLDIVDALSREDADAAGRAMRTHLANVKASVIHKLVGS